MALKQGQGVTYILIIKKSNGDTLVGPISVGWQGNKVNTIAEFRNALSKYENNPYFPKIKASILTGIFRIEIDYKYFIDNNLGDPNTFSFLVTDGEEYLELPFEHGEYGYDPSTYPEGTAPCFTIGVQIPQPGIIPPVYIYYAEEETQEIYTYYDSENKPNTYIE